ncbi:MAG: hypothetical protein JST93_22070 [Acidobacteria bacterium]|nr:hypothetical protein [Acidobacteriota bacterium]
MRKNGGNFQRDGQGHPDAYNCGASLADFGAPTFTGFNGWTNFFNLFREILKAAKDVNVNMEIGEFDLENELQVSATLVQARYVYDNKRAVDVLGSLRNIAFEEGYSRDIVTLSTPWDRPLRSDTSYCTGAYGLPAILDTPASLNEAIAGHSFGNEDYGGNFVDGLGCNGNVDNGIQLPATPEWGQLKTRDIHLGVCAGGDGNGNAGNDGYSCGTIQDCILDAPTDLTCTRFHAVPVATAAFNALKQFMDVYSHTKLRIGEAPMGQRCADQTPDFARHTVDGLRASTMRLSGYMPNLFVNAWHLVSDYEYCGTSPALLTPYNPFAP